MERRVKKGYSYVGPLGRVYTEGAALPDSVPDDKTQEWKIQREMPKQEQALSAPVRKDIATDIAKTAMKLKKVLTPPKDKPEEVDPDDEGEEV
jgi:hypothetical protein